MIGIDRSMRLDPSAWTAAQFAPLRSNRMKLIAWSFALALVSLATPAAAADEAMKRVFTCKGDDAAMEVYIPQSAVRGVGLANVKVDQPITGAYTLDLTDASKGKSLEPVHVSLSPDKKFVIVDQYTRKLPPT